MDPIRVRGLKREDAYRLSEIRGQEAVAANLLSIPVVNYQSSENFVQKSLSDPNSIQLVAEIEGKVVGTCGININSNPKINHVANLGIMVDENYHRRGVGTALLEAILKICDDWYMLKRVNLGVFESNQSAIKLYEKHGFVIEGVKQCAFKRYGKYENEVIMGRVRQ